MTGDDRLVLVSWPRTGSSSLWRILQCHPKLELFPDEPFNENFTDWSPGNQDYLARVHDITSLDLVMAELLERYDGVKVLSYQLDEDQMRHLMLRPDLRVIYIRRNNLLQIAVSDRIAKQTRLWNRWDVDASQPVHQYFSSLQPLDLDDLRDYVAGLGTHLKRIDSLLSDRDDGRVLRLEYEKLYLAGRGTQLDQLSLLWSFLELAPLHTREVDYYLDPRTARLGGSETYGQLPNAAEIDAVLGADDTGWLFPNGGE
jgi:hypothetical protein